MLRNMHLVRDSIARVQSRNRSITQELTTDFNGTFVSEPEDAAVPGGTLLVTLNCVPPESYPLADITWMKLVSFSSVFSEPFAPIVCKELRRYF